MIAIVRSRRSRSSPRPCNSEYPGGVARVDHGQQHDHVRAVPLISANQEVTFSESQSRLRPTRLYPTHDPRAAGATIMRRVEHVWNSAGRGTLATERVPELHRALLGISVSSAGNAYQNYTVLLPAGSNAAPSRRQSEPPPGEFVVYRDAPVGGACWKTL